MRDMWNPFKKKITSNDTYIQPRTTGIPYENEASGTGTKADKRTSGRFTIPLVGLDELEAMYVGGGIAKIIIDDPIDEMFKNWRKWDVDESRAEIIEDFEDDTDLKSHIKKWLKTADLYGKAYLVPLLFNHDDLETELDIKTISPGDFHQWLVFDPYTLKRVKTEFFDYAKPDFLKGEYYQLTFKLSDNDVKTVNIHPSRVFEVFGDGAPTRMILNTHGAIQGFSRLLKCYNPIRTYEEVIGAMARMVTQGTINVLSEEGMNKSLTTEHADDLIKRAEQVADIMTNTGFLVQDKESTLDRKSVTFSGLSNVLEIAQEDVSVPARIPVTKLFGKAKAGMSGDTNDGDIRNYYSNLDTRRSDFSPKMRKIDEIMFRSALGSSQRELKVKYAWNPMTVMTDSESAKVEKDRADAAATRIESGQVAAMEVRSALKENPLYNLDDAEFKKSQEELKKQQESSDEDQEND